MSSEERKKILQMVADGKISAEEAATLMRALDDSAEEQIQVIEAAPSFGSEKTDAPEFDQVRRRANRFSSAFLWIGIIFTVLSAWAMFGIQQNAGVNFWFLCLGMPLFLGILFIVMGAGSKTSRWLYVNVDRRQSHDGPKNITLGFPLPLGLTSWFLRNFGHTIQGMQNTNVDDIIQILDATGTSDEPLIVNVHNDDGDGEHVQVYIG